MGCGASRIVEQQATLNNNVQDMKDLNGHAQEVVKRSSIQSNGHDKPVVNTPETQAQPVQQAETVQQQPEPEKTVPEETSIDPKQDHDPEKPVQEEPKNSEEANEKPAPTYTEESLQEFLELENKLSSMESKGVVGQYQTQHKLLVSRYADLQVSHKKVEELKQKTAKEYRDVAAMQHPNVRAMFSDVYHLQSQMAKEQQEYMDALNQQEVAEKELKTQQEEYNALYAEVQTLQKECEELQKLRAEREKKLDEVFDGKYGSDLEGQLEMETELLTERKEMITRTRNYWSNAKVLMEHAVKQLAYATRRWAQINSVSVSMVQARYSMVAETRNYLIAASQNVTNTHRYLSNVNIPYFTIEDLRVLNNAIARIFNDIINQASFIQALQTYSSLNNKAYSLLQWISMVLEKTINKDLKEIVPLWQEKIIALKRERLRLIHVKIRELQGKDTNEEITDEMLLLQHSKEEIPEVQSDTHIAQPDTVSLKEDNTEDIPPPFTTETSQLLENKEDTVSESKDSEDQPPETKDDNKEDVPPVTESSQDSEAASSSLTDGDKPSETKDDNNKGVPPASENSQDNEAPSSSLTENVKPSETKENTPVPSTTTGDGQETPSVETDKDESSIEIAELLETAMKVKPLVELAPVPGMDVLFGNIEELKTKYEEQVAQFSKAQEVNKARLDQALQDKLQARRIRKQAIELKDTSELAKGVTTSFGKLF